MGAALAFYTALSLAPLVILVVAVVAFVFGQSVAQRHLLDQVQSVMGREGSDVVRGVIERAQQPGAGLFASLIALVTLLFGASGVFGEVQSALKTIWEVPAHDEGGIWSFVKHRFLSVGMVLAVGFLLLVSLLLSAALTALGTSFGGLLPLPAVVLNAINVVVSFLGTSVLFTLIFRYVPETRIPWRHIVIGAMVTAFLFGIGKFLIGWYLGTAAVGSAYGAAGSFVVVIVWVYYSAMIFLFGAAFTHVLHTASPPIRLKHP